MMRPGIRKRLRTLIADGTGTAAPSVSGSSGRNSDLISSQGLLYGLPNSVLLNIARRLDEASARDLECTSRSIREVVLGRHNRAQVKLRLCKRAERRACSVMRVAAGLANVTAFLMQSGGCTGAGAGAGLMQVLSAIVNVAGTDAVVAAGAAAVRTLVLQGLTMSQSWPAGRLVSAAFPNLECLVLRGCCAKASIQAFMEDVTQCRMLRSVAFHDVALEESSHLALLNRVSGLESLTMECQKHDMSFLKSLSVCQQLKRLVVREVAHEHNVQMLAACIGGLQHLHITHPDLRSAQPQELEVLRRGLPCLLHLTWNVCICPDGADVLLDWTSLASLDVFSLSLARPVEPGERCFWRRLKLWDASAACLAYLPLHALTSPCVVRGLTFDLPCQPEELQLVSKAASKMARWSRAWEWRGGADARSQWASAQPPLVLSGQLTRQDVHSLCDMLTAMPRLHVMHLYGSYLDPLSVSYVLDMAMRLPQLQIVCFKYASVIPGFFYALAKHLHLHQQQQQLMPQAGGARAALRVIEVDHSACVLDMVVMQEISDVLPQLWAVATSVSVRIVGCKGVVLIATGHAM